MSRRWFGAAAAATILGLIGALDSTIGRAQEPRSTSSPDPAITLAQQADCLGFGIARTARSPRTGAIRSVSTEPGRAVPHPRPLDAQGGPEAAARSYLALCGSLFALDRPTTQLALRAQSSELRLDDSGQFAGRRSIVRFQQTHRNIPVLAGDLVVHLDDANNITFAAGKTLTDPSVDVTATVGAADAARTAVAVVARTHDVGAELLSPGTPELWIYDSKLLGAGDTPARLVWKIEVTPRDVRPIRELVLVDARRGSVALHFNQIETVQNRATYTAGGGTTLPGTLVCNESNPTCSGGDADAVAAHQYAADTYAFYFNTFGRDSINNSGLTITSTVHYSIGYTNAYWDGTQMVYGDGYSKADDVVGHELTHGVTQYTSGLLYYYESGAINESLSDVFGELIDQTNGHGNDAPSVRWLLGEDVPGGAIRSMSDPTLFSDPDRMTSAYWAQDLSAVDNGGVHTNSGVNNKAAFLMVDGGTFNGQTITALGITKTAKIYYEVQTHLLTSGSDYGDLYDALYQGCVNLIGTSGITAADCQQVRNVTIATEMNKPAWSAIPEAALCVSGQAPTNVFFDNLENGSSNFVFGANVGTVRWTYDSPYFRYAHSGLHFLYADDVPATVSDSWVAMANSVTVPANGYLHFAHADRFSQTTSDGGVVEYSTNGGATWIDAGPLFEANGYGGGTLTGTNPLAGRSAFTRTSRGYTSSRVNLSTLAGQNVRFRWRMALDSSGFDWGWWIDDVRVYSCPIGNVTADSMTPSSGTGTSQTFAFQYSDSVGSSDISVAWVWFNASGAANSSCMTYYQQATNQILLLNDAGTTWTSGTVGSATTLQNSQCAIPLSAASTSASGNTLTWNLPLIFKAAFAGPKTVSMFAASYGATNSGWQTPGSWTIPASGPFTPIITWPSPANISYGTPLGASQLNATASVPGTFVYSPPAGTVLPIGASQTLSATFTPTDTTTYTTATATRTITVSKGLPVITWPTPANIVVGTPLGPTQLNATASVPGTFVYSPPAGTVLGLGNNQVLQVTFTPSDLSTYTIVTTARLINVVSSTAGVATAVSVTPSSGSGATQTFDFVFADTAGFTDIRLMELLIQSPSNGTFLNNCFLMYDRTTNRLSLDKDDNSGSLTTTFPGTGTLQNSQCGVVLDSSSAFGSGNTLTLRLAMVFKPAYVGLKTIYALALGMTQSSATWQTMGSWTVPGSKVITADSVTPSAGSGGTQSFAFTYSDSAGYAELATAWLWFSPTLAMTSANSCAAYYDGVERKLVLLSDSGASSSMSPIPSTGTLQNSQCSIDLANSFVQGSGNSMVVTLRIAFATAFGGTKNIYMLASGQNGGNTGWVARGTWTVPGAAPITPTVTWAAPANITYGTALGGSQLNATANVPGSFAYTPPAGTILSAGSGQTLSVLFTPTDTTTYTTATKTTTINVLKATPTITWPTPADITAGTALSATQLNATANVPGTFAYTPPAGTVLPTGQGQTLSVTFTPTNGSNYNSAAATVSINVVAPPAVLSADSVTPSSGSGSAQTFSLQYGDTAGASDVSTAWVWFNAGGSVVNSCLVYVDRPASTLYLLNDGATTWMSAVLGSASTLQNGQCQIGLTGATATPSGNTLTISLPVTFAPTFVGVKNISMFAAGLSGTSSGWSLRGTYTVTNGGLIAPTVTWATPANITYGTPLGGSQLNATANVPGTFVYTPAAGTVLPAGTAQTLSVQFTPTDTATYSTATKTTTINVLNATPTITWPTPANITAGTALSATQLNATANVPGTFAYSPPAGTVLSAGSGQTLSVTFTPTDTSNYNAATATVLISVVSGTVSVTADSATPSSGSGASQPFTFQYSDTSGASELTTTWVLFNSTSSSVVNACLIYYHRPTQTVFLLNDAGTAWLSRPATAGSTMSNAQCGVTVGAVAASGTTLSFGLSMTFAPGFAGVKNIYMYAIDSTAASSGWQTRGTWTVPGAVSVSADSVTPGSGGGASQTFALQYSDTAGATDLATTWVWFSPTIGSSAANSCLAYYTRATNTILLLNDAGTTWMSGTPGGPGTLQNSQCSIALASTTIGVNGTALTVNAAMSFTPAFTGSRNIYMFAANGANVTSGWQNRGSWTMP